MMSEKKQKDSAKMQIVGHFIKDLSFENFAARDSKQGAGTPNIDVKLNLDASKSCLLYTSPSPRDPH